MAAGSEPTNDGKWAPLPELPDWERCLVWAQHGVRCQKPQGHRPTEHEWRHASSYFRITWPMGFGHLFNPQAPEE